MKDLTQSAESLVLKCDAQFPGFSLKVDLRLPGRGVSALFGPSGSGKSSCLRVMAGLLRAEAAYISVGGQIWQDSGSARFLPVHERALGYVSQRSDLFPHLNVRENLDFGARRRGKRNAPGLLPDICALLDLESLLGRLPAQLSGGEQQRVAIGRALLAAPRLLLLDEPLAALDLERKREILPYLERLHAQLDIPVLYVSHSPDEVLRLADHLTLLDDGRVRASGPLEEVLSRQDLDETLADDFGSVIQGRCLGYDEAYGLAEIHFPGGRLHILHTSPPQGTRLRVQIRARDLSLTHEAPEGSSILNVLPVELISCRSLPERGQTLVYLKAGASPLVARITRLSQDRLDLRPGQRLWAQVKSVALLA